MITRWNPPENREKADSCSVYLILSYISQKAVIPFFTAGKARKTKDFEEYPEGSDPFIH